MAEVVIDASALVDLLLRSELGDAVDRRVRGQRLHAPAHIEAETLSAVGRMHRAGLISADEVEAVLRVLSAAPIVRHELKDLVLGAWARRDRVRLVDALYIELASRLDLPLITTDLRLRNEPQVETVEV